MSRLATALLVWSMLIAGPMKVAAQAIDGPLLMETRASEVLLDSARTDLYAYRMASAERLLRRLEARPDGEAAARYHLTLAALHRALMSGEEEQFVAFFDRSGALSDALADHPAGPWRDLMASDRDLWRAAAFMKQGRYLRAAWSGRSAYRTYERVAAAFPDFYEVRFGLGLLHMAIGSMPSSLRFLLDVLGYDGEVEQGLGELDLARRHARYVSEEASAMQAIAYEMLSLDESTGLRIAADLHGRHPQSPLAAHVHGFMLLAVRDAEGASQVLSAAIRQAERGDVFYLDYLDFYMAEARFRLDDFEGAERYYRRYLNRHGGPALKAMAYMGLGKSLEMQGRRSAAVEAFEQVRAARTFDTDEAARREAERLLLRPLSDRERTLLLATNAFDSDRLAAASRLLTAIRKEPGLTTEQEAEAAFRLGRVHLAEEAFEAAVAEFERAEALRGDPLSRWAPWSAYYIGRSRLEQGRYDEAEAAFGRALAYEGRYDYYQALEQSVRAARELLLPD